jgi:hypothetical protein
VSEATHTALRAALLARQNGDGGFGAHPGSPSATEPTAVSLLALSFEPEPVDTVPLRAWLRGHETPEHGWPVMTGLREPSWATALVVLALARYPAEAEVAQRGAEWLVGERGRTVEGRSGLLARLLAPSAPAVELDGALVGWPWTDGTFSWVEPTAYAVLALRAVTPRPPAATARIDEGTRLLLDRVCRDGGWNYGNRRVLGADLWSYPDTTALALLALGRRADGAVAAKGLAALETMLETNQSGLATALGALALAAHGREIARLRARLGTRFAETAFAGDARALAWALLATNEAAAPFVEAAHA